jgi:Protein of unknown function (DUF2934)
MRKHVTQEIAPNHENAGSSYPAGFDLEEEAIAALAYHLWVERGRPEGSAEEDWFRAEEILRSGRATLTASST